MVHYEPLVGSLLFLNSKNIFGLLATMARFESFGVYFILILCKLLTNIHGQCNQNHNGICYIDGSLSNVDALQCGTNKCIVNCPSYGSCTNKQIICPYDAEYCIINCDAVNSFYLYDHCLTSQL